MSIKKANNKTSRHTKTENSPTTPPQQRLRLTNSVSTPSATPNTSLSLLCDAEEKKVSDDTVNVAEEKNEKNADIRQFSLHEISKHKTKNDLWIIIEDDVIEVTSFLQYHPVSRSFIMQYGGSFATDAFNSASHSSYAKKLVNKLKIGVLAVQDRINSKSSTSDRRSVIDWDKLEKSSSLLSPIKIDSIFIYPVKGCQGIKVKTAIIDESGLLNDRMYCIVDVDKDEKANNIYSVVNQLKYQKLAFIQPALKDPMYEKTNEIELSYFDQKTNKLARIVVPTVYDRRKMIAIQFKNSPSTIFGYDQGNKIANWITRFIYTHHDMSTLDRENKTFRFCKIINDHERYHSDYFSLPFIHKKHQPIKGVLNYSSINIASQESMDELNRRAKKSNNKSYSWDRFKVNMILKGLPSPHFEDFCKFLSIENERQNVELLWNRRRYFCTVPNVDQKNGKQTSEPQQTLTRYRNGVTLNDITCIKECDAVFFGSFYIIKNGGIITVGDTVNVKQTQFNTLRTTRESSYYGLNSLKNQMDLNFQIKSLAQFNEYRLIEKIKFNHNCFQFRFMLKHRSRNSRESLKLNIGGHYLFRFFDDNSCTKIKGNIAMPVIRAYTPIVYENEDEEDEDDQYFDLIVKIYKNGKMTQYLSKMKVSDTIMAKQHYNTIRCLEIGLYEFGDPFYAMLSSYKLRVNEFNMFCAGTGITPMYQIIHSINRNKYIDKTKICLFYANQTYQDILLLDKLKEIQKTNKNIKMYFIVERVSHSHSNNDIADINDIINDVSKVGFINKELMVQYAYKASKQTISLLCGPDAFVKVMKNYLHQIQFADQHIYVF